MRPTVTVVTPSFNQGRYIEETIRSVIEQDYEPVEHLVYDAGSTDETHSVLERYRDRIHAVIGPDDGQADAINRGFRAARGEIIAWLNSDDVYKPGAIRAGVEYLVAHPECAMVYGKGEHIDAQGSSLGPYPTAPPSELSIFCVVCQPASFMRREAVASVGYVDAGLRYCMDYDLWLRLAAEYEIAHLPIELACSRLHSEAKSVNQQFAFLREIIRMTHRRLGRAPLVYLYGYANMLVCQRFAVRRPLPTLVRRLAATAVTSALALRYHRRPRLTELRHAVSRALEVSKLRPQQRML
jgi:glycosyltransferase involved in cell wall biosynthesis